MERFPILTFLVLLTACQANIHQKQCGLEGWWANQRNSYVYLDENAGTSLNELTGWYFPAETSTANVQPQQLRGIGSKTSDHMVVWSLMFNGGLTKAFIGQCYLAEGKPKMITLWYQRSPSVLEDSWKSTRVGEDIWTPTNQPPAHFIIPQN